MSNPDVDVKNIDADIYPGDADDDFTAVAPILALFDYFRYRDDDGNNAVWTATIPVYKEINDPGDGCANPHGGLEIVGFAEIEVIEIGPPLNDDPRVVLVDKSVKVYINCEKYFLPVRGGGATFGFLRGTIPNLVE